MKDKIGGASTSTAVTTNVYRVLATKPQRKRPLGMIDWRAVVNTVMKIYIPKIAKNFFNN